jgi:hypothetical protein
MNAQKLLYWLLVIISVTTLISGIVQIFNPAFILRLISAEVTPTTGQLFGTVGMFMALFGGMLLQVLHSKRYVKPVFLWAGLQKIAASIAVPIGFCRHLFGPFGLGVAGFDLLSGILIFVYMAMLSREERAQ